MGRHIVVIIAVASVLASFLPVVTEVVAGATGGETVLVQLDVCHTSDVSVLSGDGMPALNEQPPAHLSFSDSSSQHFRQAQSPPFRPASGIERPPNSPKVSPSYS